MLLGWFGQCSRFMYRLKYSDMPAPPYYILFICSTNTQITLIKAPSPIPTLYLVIGLVLFYIFPFIFVYIWMKDNSSKNSRSKRSLMAINLVETPAGYSIIEGTELLNKNPNQPPPPSISNAISHLPSAPLAAKEQKMSIKHNSLLFLKAPTKFESSAAEQQSMASRNNIETATPSCLRQYAKWFKNQSQVHEIQRNQLALWIKQDHPQLDFEQIPGLDMFEEAVQKYKKHRNIIINAYAEKYAPKKQYLSASAIRKFICDDAYWLMRIHVFLSSQGIINNSNINLDNQHFRPTEIFRKNAKENKYDVLPLKAKKNIPFSQYPEKGYFDEKNQLLKKITNDIRPYCDFCGIHCGIFWFQHLRTMDPKEISTIMKNVNSKNPPLSEKQYEIVLCAKCYCNGSYPLLLTHHDFRKITINDKLEPDRKKKTSKHKRKQEKRKRKEKEKQMIEDGNNEEEKEEEEILHNGTNNINHQNNDEEAQKPKQDMEESEVVQKGRRGRKKKKGNHQVKAASVPAVVTPISNNSLESPTTIAENNSKVNEMIKEIVGKISEPKAWSYEETSKLLELIEKYGQDWDQIHKMMVKSGYCYDCGPEDLIQYFLNLPKSEVTSLNEQYDPEQFANTNRNVHKSTFLNKVAQKTLDDSITLAQILKKEKSSPMQEQTTWKERLDKLAVLQIKKIETKISMTEELQAKSLKMNKYCEEIKRDIQDD